MRASNSSSVLERINGPTSDMRVSPPRRSELEIYPLGERGVEFVRAAAVMASSGHRLRQPWLHTDALRAIPQRTNGNRQAFSATVTEVRVIIHVVTRLSGVFVSRITVPMDAVKLGYHLPPGRGWRANPPHIPWVRPLSRLEAGLPASRWSVVSNHRKMVVRVHWRPSKGRCR